MAKFSRVPISHFLCRVRDDIYLQDDMVYKQVTVRLWNKGVVLRGEQKGYDIKTKRQFFVHAGQIVLSRIDVRNGAIGLVPPELDKAIVSNDFWVYDMDVNIIDPNYFALCVTTPSFIHNSDLTSSGTTKRIRAEESQFLRIEIPLPTLEEQRRIVGRIEALAGRVREALSLRERAVEETNKLINAELNRIFSDSKDIRLTLRDVSHFQRGRFSWRPRNDSRFYGGQYPFIQIGDIPKDSKFITNHSQTLNEDGLKISIKFPAGTIVISIAATIGAVGILGFDSCMPDSLVGMSSIPDITLTDYLYYFLRFSQSHLETIAPQSAQKNINIRILDQIKIPVPSLDEQRRIVTHLDAVQAKVDELRRLQAETKQELAALLPSILDKAFKGEL